MLSVMNCGWRRSNHIKETCHKLWENIKNWFLTCVLLNQTGSTIQSKMTTYGYSDKSILFVKFKYSMMRIDYVFLYLKIQCAYVMVNELIIISTVRDQYINLCLSSKSSISSILHKVEPKISQYLFHFLSYFFTIINTYISLFFLIVDFVCFYYVHNSSLCYLYLWEVLKFPCAPLHGKTLYCLIST